MDLYGLGHLATFGVKAQDLWIASEANYQPCFQDGVKWLAFLNRYKLHGVLCDEMGLGKTLQTICIVASDHHNKIAAHQVTSLCFIIMQNFLCCRAEWGFTVLSM